METVEMTRELAGQLRTPFAAETIGKLPRITCGNCRDDKYKVCASHKKTKCATCGNYISTQHMHLDFVGHAEVTDRLLQADPLWSWEPLAIDAATGLPKFDQLGGLWIRLTIAGVTRLGYGDAAGKKGADAVKEVIGDAIRNGAMRFGVGLDLWGAKFKDPDENQDTETPVSTRPPSPPRASRPAASLAKKPQANPERLEHINRMLETATSASDIQAAQLVINAGWAETVVSEREQMLRWVKLAEFRIEQDATATGSQEELSLAGAA